MESIIIESCKRVYEQLGFGLMELTYEKALKCELLSRNIKCENEYYVNMFYESSDNEKHFLTPLRIDILINNPKIVIELKTVKSVLKNEDKEFYQVTRYQGLVNAEQCYLVNFGIKGLEIYRCTGGEFEKLN